MPLPVPGLRRLAALLVTLATLAGPAAAQNADLTLLHFNDIYEITPVDGQGGFAPLATLLERERQSHALTLTTLGGDFLSPSLLSGATKGQHMVALLGQLGVEVAVFGNHEFDFGPEVARQRLGESAFPWLATNIEQADGQPFAHAPVTWTRRLGDVTVGLFGVITPSTAVSSSPGPEVHFLDPIAPAQAAVAALRQQGAQVVVALTHLDLADDRALVRAVKGIDVVLGGHDHDPIAWYENGALILKAGYDGHYLGAVDLAVRTPPVAEGQPGATPGKTKVTVRGWRFLATEGEPAEPRLAAAVAEWQQRLSQGLDQPLATLGAPLDSRRDLVRTREAPVGNLYTDALRAALQADVALLNGGGFRGDRVYPAGAVYTGRDVLAELPFGNVGVLVQLSGADLRAALEHGLAAVERKAGRFPQVSGLTLRYDPQAPAGQRLRSLEVGGRPLEDQATYRVATSDYLLNGGDGYQMLAQGKVLIDPSGAKLIATDVIDALTAGHPIPTAPEGRIVAEP